MLRISATFSFPVRVDSANANNSERENLFATLRDSLAKLETDGSAFTLQLDNTSCLHVPIPEPTPEPTVFPGGWWTGFTDDELRAARDNDCAFGALSANVQALMARAPRQLQFIGKGWRELKITNFKPESVYRLCKADVNNALRRNPATIEPAPETKPMVEVPAVVEEPIATPPIKAEVVIPEGWRQVKRGRSHKGDQELTPDNVFKPVDDNNVGWHLNCYGMLIRKIKARWVPAQPANTQSHIFLADGRVMVPRKAKNPGFCDGCQLMHNNEARCNRIPCQPRERDDKRTVVWVESKCRWNKPGYEVPTKK